MEYKTEKILCKVPCLSIDGLADPIGVETDQKNRVISAIIWEGATEWWRFSFIWHRPLINDCQEVHERDIDLCTIDVDKSILFVEKNFSVKNPTKVVRLSTRNPQIDYIKEVGFLWPKTDN